MLLKQYIAHLLILIAVGVGLCSYPSYGVTWDEDDQRIIGQINYDYAFKGEPGLEKHILNKYGPAYELPLSIVENKFGFTDVRSIFLFRHLATHLLFLLACFCFYKSIDLLYKDRVLGIVGMLMLLLMPAIYGHSFYNTKDIPFLSFIIFSWYLAIRAYQQPGIFRFVALGAMLGLLINLRIIGAILPVGLLLMYVFAPGSILLKTKHLAIGITSCLVVLLASFPFLWSNPIENFGQVYLHFSKVNWDALIFFNGESVASTKLPWYYIPVWFGVTVPIPYLLVGILGIGAFLIRTIQQPKSLLKDNLLQWNALFLICFIAPPLAAILLKSVLLDSWRHMYFIYPSFVMLGIFGLHEIKSTRIKYALLGVLGIGFLTSLAFMVKNAPLQHLYFNRLVQDGSPEKLRNQFEMDYWGGSYKQALDYILAQDTSASIQVNVDNYPGKANVAFLPKDQRARIEIVDDRTKADYYITNYRNRETDYSVYKDQKWYSVMVENNTVCTVFKLK